MLSKKDFSSILTAFLLWFEGIYVIHYFSKQILPLQFGYLGGGAEQYLKKPGIWAFINFDGEHYLSIANHGYRHLQHFYFPFYIILTRTFGAVFNIKAASAGLLAARLAFFISLIGLYKLLMVDEKQPVVRRAIVLLLLFPTSFYFASFYTESVFLALVVWSLYFARTKRWLFAGILGAFATATRLVGLALFPALLTEVYLQRKVTNTSQKRVSLIATLFMLSGILAYMYFLWQTAGDPLVFYNKVDIFGAQRNSSLILLPQVFYRYLFKIIPSLDYTYFPVVFTTWLELVTSIVFALLLIYAFFKQRASYVAFFAAAFLLPTLSGSFSSLPRYVLIIFPAFLLASKILDRINKAWRYLIYFSLLLAFVVSGSLFLRGYWIS